VTEQRQNTQSRLLDETSAALRMQRPTRHERTLPDIAIPLHIRSFEHSNADVCSTVLYVSFVRALRVASTAAS
jgi:hypothetical protein